MKLEDLLVYRVVLKLLIMGYLENTLHQGILSKHFLVHKKVLKFELLIHCRLL